MKLQQLQLDLEVIALADVARLVLSFADIDRLLGALQVQFGKTQSGFGEQHGDELLGHIEGETAFGIRDLGTRHGCLIARSLQAVLPFLAAFKQISDAGVELLDFVQIVFGEVGRRKNWYELGIEVQSGVGSQVRGDFLRLVLQDESACRLQRVIVRNRQIDGLVHGDQRWALGISGGGERQQASQSCHADHPEVRWTHRTQI